MENWQEREELLIGKDNIEKLKNATVAVFGCGGVGSYAVEALARAGIGNFVLVDKDVVDVTNINRQLVADFSTIGRDKVEVEKERILRVNPDAKVEIYKEFYCEENKDKLIREDYTYIVDAIDSVSSKLSLIITAHEKNVKIISAMGMGNKLDPTQIEVSDISKTSVCPLAKTIRKQLRANGINHLKVVYSRELPNRFDKSEEYRRTTASISFVPSVGGLIIASQIVRDLIDESLKKSHELNEKCNAFVTIMDDVKEDAVTEDLLSGIPYGIKDNYSTKDILSTGSSNTLKDYVPFFDATAVANLKKHGAVGVNKTALDEFGMGGNGTTAHTGVIRNPWDTKRMCAGSSSGSAAAVAAGVYPYALGSDTGDSIRKPAAFCGIVGYKPTYGMISRYGLFPFASSLDTCGVLTRSVEDAAIVVDSMKGIDKNDQTSWDSSNIHLYDSLNGDVKGKTIAMLGLAFKPDTDDMREAPALVVIDKLLKDGAIVKVFDPIAMPECKRRIGDVVTYTENLYDCADGADALLLMTEWRQFRLPTWNVIQKVMTDKYIVDGRNIWNRVELEEMGFSYTRIGEK